MPKKIPPLLVEKYDIANKILNLLADLESRHILFGIIKSPKTAQELAVQLQIPTSSVYKKIKDLSETGLVFEYKEFSENGRIIKYYQSKIDDAQIIIKNFEPSISLNKNKLLKR